MRRPFPFPVAAAAFLVLAALGLSAQESPVPEALKNKALTISIQAFVLQDGTAVAWHEEGIRYTVPGTPVALRLVGSNVVIVIQVTPYDDGKNSVTLVTQGQVWVKGGNGELSYRTTLDSVTVGYGEKVLYFPLGRAPDGRAPMRVEISADHYNPLGQQGAAGQAGTPVPPPTGTAGPGPQGTAAPPAPALGPPQPGKTQHP